ncbi:MAG: glutamyl-tRNA reductase [Candidatus Humimicrobiaceae bacterium]
MINIYLTGLNYKKAPMHALEKFSFNEQECLNFLVKTRSIKQLNEIVLLSTCNRTELYCITGQENNQFNGKLLSILTDYIGLDSQSLKDYFYHASNSKAVNHLFQVAAGLDSMVLGEDQILSQVKKAYSIAVEAKTVNRFFHKLFHQAFRVGKRCRHETKISSGAASVGSVAIELIQKNFSNISDKKILLIGAGNIAQVLLSNLKNTGSSDITIVNRTLSKAQKLAQVFNAEVLPLIDLSKALRKSNIIITSVASKQEILSFDTVKQVMLERKNSPLLIVDIAVPHNVEHSVKSLYNVFLYNIYDLQQIAEKNMHSRKKEIISVKKIITEELKEYEQWYSKQYVIPTIKDLNFFFDKIRQQEVERYGKNFCEKDLKDLDLFSRSLINKILYPPMIRLNECAIEHNFCGACTIRKIFGLDKDE